MRLDREMWLLCTAHQRVPAHSARARTVLRSLPEYGVKLHQSNLIG